jgi:hypothetical protein
MSLDSSATYLKGVYGASRAMGDKLVSSDFTFEPVGFETIALLMKGFSIPFISAGEPVEVPLPTGGVMLQPSQIAIHNQTGVSLMETVAGHLDQFSKNVLARNGGYFDAKIYSGTPDRYFQVWTLRDCFIRIEPAEADTEARTQLLSIGGTLSYHYFGEVQAGPLLIVPA